MRLSKKQAADLAAHKKALHSDRELLETVFDVFWYRLEQAAKEVNAIIALHSANVRKASAFVTEVAADLRDAYDEKSERWQETEAGQAALEMGEAWENVDLDEIEPVQVLLPDRPVWNESLNLPEESDQ